MKRLFLIALFLLLPASGAWADRASATSQTLLILPFENASRTPGLEWIGESFSEVLGDRMNSAALYAVPRDDRSFAFDRAGVPANLRPSHATLFRIGEQLDVDYLVLGRYGFDGRSFSAEAQVLDVKRLRLSPPVSESGALTALIDIQTALAWDLLKAIRPEYEITRNEFLADSPPVRLDALENYIRGITAAGAAEKINRFREALRINPAYVQAMMQLGRAYFAARDYGAAATTFGQVPRTDPACREASFYAGLAYYYTGEFDKAENAFSYLSSLFPLTEVYNNLGVVAARRGKKSAADYFEKAVEADEHDPDYRFNFGVALARGGDIAGAARQLREALRLRPSDTEARTLLDGVSRGDTSARTRAPLERIKRNYDETSFRQLALEIQNATEGRLANTDPRTHAAYHVEHAHMLLQQKFMAEAGREFREAILLDPANAAAHAGLAAVWEASNHLDGARSEADAALKLGPCAEAYLVLARLEWRANRRPSAVEQLAKALALEPANPAALELQRIMAEKPQESP